MRKYLLSILALLVLSSPIYSSWYTGVSFGVSCLNIEDMKDMYFSLKDEGMCANVFTGYEFEKYPVRIEQQLSMGKHYFDSNSICGFKGYKKDLPFYSWCLTENIIVDLEFPQITPYVGVGIGYHWAKGTGEFWILDDMGEKYTIRIKKFVFQSIFGVKKSIRDDMDVSLECRVKLSKDKNLQDHGIFLGLRSYM